MLSIYFMSVIYDDSILYRCTGLQCASKKEKLKKLKKMNLRVSKDIYILKGIKI